MNRTRDYIMYCFFFQNSSNLSTKQHQIISLKVFNAVFSYSGQSQATTVKQRNEF